MNNCNPTYDFPVSTCRRLFTVNCISGWLTHNFSSFPATGGSTDGPAVFSLVRVIFRSFSLNLKTHYSTGLSTLLVICSPNLEKQGTVVSLHIDNVSFQSKALNVFTSVSA